MDLFFLEPTIEDILNIAYTVYIGMGQSYTFLFYANNHWDIK